MIHSIHFEFEPDDGPGPLIRLARILIRPIQTLKWFSHNIDFSISASTYIMFLPMCSSKFHSLLQSEIPTIPSVVLFSRMRIMQS
jgi:hypothetical protein